MPVSVRREACRSCGVSTRRERKCWVSPSPDGEPFNGAKVQSTGFREGREPTALPVMTEMPVVTEMPVMPDMPVVPEMPW